MPRLDPAWTATTAIAGYHLVQNLALPERAYVPVNLAVSAGLVAYALHHGVRPEEMGLDPADLPSGLLWGAGTAGAVAAATGALSLIRPDHPMLLDERAAGHDRGEAAYRTLARFPLGTALFEEISFRGVLYGLWSQRLGHRRAEAVTALAFGAWHLLPTHRAFLGSALAGDERDHRQAAAAAIAGALLTGASSFAFGFLRTRSRSIVAPWMAHAAFNVAGYLASRRAWRNRAET